MIKESTDKGRIRRDRNVGQQLPCSGNKGISNRTDLPPEDIPDPKSRVFLFGPQVSKRR